MSERKQRSGRQARLAREGTPVPRDRKGPAHQAVNDPKASKGSTFARGGNLSGEGNSPDLVHGPTRTRRIPPDRDGD